ncbi:MAG: hypothetical protein HZA01_12690 [Nitrospinae bacterium]|nr:hypothetical protein [Nitrospinota bacterium]
MPKTEFYEIAVEHGFYCLEKSGLFGKKDNARKYWEEIALHDGLSVPARFRFLREKHGNYGNAGPLDVQRSLTFFAAPGGPFFQRP